MIKNTAPRIFLSSTSLDLVEERNSAKDAIQKNYFCINMETWGGSPNPPKEKIVEEIQHASAVVLILGFKYGSLIKDEEISYTEFEFNYAKENEIDIFAFIKKDENGKWNPDEENDVISNKLEKFKENIEDGLTVEYFTNVEELKEQVLNTLSKNDDKIQKNKDFTDKFFKDKLKGSINELGHRYNPEINIDLELDFFNVMAKNKAFKEKFDIKFVDYYCELKRLNIPQNYKKDFDNALENLKNEYNEIFKDIDYDFNKLYYLIKNIEGFLEKISNELDGQTDKKHKIDVLIYQSREYMDTILGYSYKLLKNPILILTGDAGCGKSHLLADLACKRMNNEEVTVLQLGTHFNSDENIGKQIVNELELDMSSTEFLEKLNNKAKYQKSRILIIIDGLNECKNGQLWKNRLNRFISEIKNYKWLGLIVSIRNTYIDLLPEDIINKNNHYNHRNLGNKTFEGIKIFCNHYNVNYPSFPPISPIFSNPLFLKLLFENMEKSNINIIPQDSLDFSSIIRDYFKNIEGIIHRNPSVPLGFNITKMFVDKVIELKISNPSSELFYEDLFEIGTKISNKLNMQNFQIIDILIKEGLFYKDRSDAHPILKFSYEKIEDYLVADYLLENIKKENLHDEFKEDGEIYRIISEGDEINFYGVFEAFAVLIPEKFGIELFEIDFSAFNLKNIINDKLFDWFINSLYWRKPKTINENIFDYILNEIKKSEHNFTLFFESMIQLSSNPEYILNSKKLHELLLNYPMPERDSYWLPWIDKQYRLEYSVYNVVEWTLFLKNINQINDDSLKLLTIMLSWFLASNNKELRDKSTYALINILKYKPKILLEILELFENLDDMYIIERLYAIAYACVLNYKNSDDIKILAEYTYTTIFVKNNFKPNILLKDYGQNIIDYSNLKFNLKLNTSKFKYAFPKIPFENEINKIEKKYFSKPTLKGGCYIFSSMQEHVGNFGRNEFKNKIKYWNHEFTYNDLRKLIIKRTFEFYDEKLHGSYDISIEKNKYNLIHPYTYRIGEKYQRIAFYELLDMLSTNYKITHPWTTEDKHYLKGAWEIGIRNFDPTFNFKNKIKTTDSFSNLINFNISKEKWSESLNGMPKIETLLNQQKIFNKNDDWLLLFGQINLNDSNELNFKCHEPTKGLFLELWGLIIKKDEKQEIVEKLKYEEISRITPDHDSFYQVFDKEFSWANSYSNLKENNEFEKIIYFNHPIKNSIHIPFDENLWEFNNYLEKDFNKNLLKPSKLLFDEMNLEYGDNDNVLYSNDTELMIDLSNGDNFEYNLIINKKELLSFLNKNNLDIIWLIHGFKITYENWSHNYDKQLYIEGIYYLNANYKLVGNLTYNHYENHYIANKKTKIIHLNSCKYVKSIKKENINEEFVKVDDAINEGFKPCSKCLSYFNKFNPD